MVDPLLQQRRHKNIQKTIQLRRRHNKAQPDLRYFCDDESWICRPLGAAGQPEVAVSADFYDVGGSAADCGDHVVVRRV